MLHILVNGVCRSRVEKHVLDTFHQRNYKYFRCGPPPFIIEPYFIVFLFIRVGKGYASYEAKRQLIAVMSSKLTTNQCFDVEQMRKCLNQGSHLCYYFFFENMKRIHAACDHRSFSGIQFEI